MRVLYGDMADIHCPLLIMRGISTSSIEYFETFLKNNPTRGLLLCAEQHQDPKKYLDMKPSTETAIHKVYFAFQGCSDEELVDLLLKKFPLYSEEADPVVTTDPVKGMCEEFSEKLKKGFRLPEEMFRDTLREPYHERRDKIATFGEHDFRSMRVLPCTVLFARSELRMVEEDEAYVKRAILALKSDLLSVLMDNDDFWNVHIENLDYYRKQITVKMGVAVKEKTSLPRLMGDL